MHLVPVDDAETLILNLVHPLQETEEVPLTDSLDRILAFPVTSKLDFPYWDNSAMDGYAVRFEDVQECSQERPITLSIIEEIRAGYPPQKTIISGQTARIFTGAMLPSGADTIVMQENTQREGDKVQIFQAPQPQEFVRYRASFYQAGNPLLSPGIALTPPDLAILATVQCPRVRVYRRPRVAIFSTGDELINPDEVLQPGKIVDSNQYALAGFVRQLGAIPIALGKVGDRPEPLKAMIKQAIQTADIVLSTGGVSVGDYDFIEAILAELGGEIHIRSIHIKPGKPLTVATFPNCLYFGIPGNPVSALVSCWRFVAPTLKKLSGLATNWGPTWLKAKTLQNLKSDGKKETYLWGQLQLVGGVYEFSLAGGSHSSGNLMNLSQTNGLAKISVGSTSIASGEVVEVIQVG